ncbi:MAG: radical SAM protein [Methanothrix sp.]|uniref:tetraether lipid synthase Tes n=1 Tax=Methanothrix sp. TaxID=90426 RepID=UPI0025DEB9B9|nr:radical SAM protein [Methanothrix sp.]MCQ8903125.1 radical SAM protein [Methanothrix sp.]
MVVMTLNTIDRVVASVCPVCLRTLSARIFQQGQTVMIRKSCPEHGEFEDVYWSDADLYRRFVRYAETGRGIENFITKGDCPFSCGLCDNHKTSTLLANIDVTTRCNLACPICFADASPKRVYEPTMEQIERMLKILREERPVPCQAVQFSGGEPTVREDLPEIVALARSMGFTQIQIATNGLRLASHPHLARRLCEAGLSTVYLQFDGVDAGPYIKMRGRDLLGVKLSAIESCRRGGLRSVVLVPTVAKGVNDFQLGDIIRFASQNVDVIRGVNMQPISFAGRVEEAERRSNRITIPDLLRSIEEQTDGQVSREDFYPVPFVAPISRVVEVLTERPTLIFTVHPCCGAATYVYCEEDRLIPITRFVDVEGLMERLKDILRDYNGSKISKLRIQGALLKDLLGFIDESRAPKDLHITKLLMNVLRTGTFDSLREFHSRNLFIGAMHFQDLYNLDLERVSRCGIHYATPDGRIIPFCTYNTIHRSEVEDRYSIAETCAPAQRVEVPPVT